MGRDKRVEEALNRLEQGIEKIAEVFDQYTETVRQEIAFINQRILDLESKIDNIENWHSFSGETPKHLPLRPEAAPETTSQMGTKPTPMVSRPTPIEDYTQQMQEEPTPAEESYSPPARTPPPRQPARRTIEPASFISKEDLGLGGAPSQEEEIGRYRPSRGGIVEEKFVKPSVFSRELNKLQEAAATAPQTLYGPGGVTPPPSMQLRQQISAVLGKIRPEAQVRAPRPSPVQYGPTAGYHAPTPPTDVGTYGPPPPQPAYAAEPLHTAAPAPAGEVKTISVPDNWLPESSRAKYYNPKQLKKGDLKEMEKKTKDIFK